MEAILRSGQNECADFFTYFFWCTRFQVEWRSEKHKEKCSQTNKLSHFNLLFSTDQKHLKIAVITIPPHVDKIVFALLH